ncbi:hypothetical protein L1887_42066 [Cichorium endivia]|nr:hypothetical protein L1887_42066 [Cichorium endivia]
MQLQIDSRPSSPSVRRCQCAKPSQDLQRCPGCLLFGSRRPKATVCTVEPCPPRLLATGSCDDAKDPGSASALHPVHQIAAWGKHTHLALATSLLSSGASLLTPPPPRPGPRESVSYCCCCCAVVSSVAWSQEDPAQGLTLRTAPVFYTLARLRGSYSPSRPRHCRLTLLVLSSRALIRPLPRLERLCLSYSTRPCFQFCSSYGLYRSVPGSHPHPVPLCLLAAALSPPDSCVGWCAEQLVHNVLVLRSTAPPV